MGIRVLGNPVRGSCVLRLTGGDLDGVKVQVFDVAGRLRRTIPSEEVGGSPIVTWDLRTDAGLPCAPGVYFVRVTNARGGKSAETITIIP